MVKEVKEQSLYTDWFNLYSGVILKRIEVPLGFLIVEHTTNNITYVYDGRHRNKLQYLLDKWIKESGKKGLTIIYTEIASGASVDVTSKLEPAK